MNFDLAQSIILTTLGNEYLKNGKITPHDLNNHVFQLSQGLSFGELNPEPIRLTNHSLAWFEFLRKNGVQKIRLLQVNLKHNELPNRIEASFQGGSQWIIEAVYKENSDYWIKSSEVTNGPLIFDYIKLFNQSTSNLQFDREKLKIEFSKVLNRIYEFAQKNKLNHWAKKFDEARYALEFEDGTMLFPSLTPTENYDLINHQLMLAVNYTDIFGGMGSWNDLGFNEEAEQKTYGELSDKLWKIRNQAIVASVNKDKLEAE